MDQLSDWYRVSRKALKAKGGESALSGYPSLGALLQATYPDHPWQPELFVSGRAARHGPWVYGRNARGFFDEYAKEKGFDPLNAENWYFSLRIMLRKKVPPTPRAIRHSPLRNAIPPGRHGNKQQQRGIPDRPPNRLSRTALRAMGRRWHCE